MESIISVIREAGSLIGVIDQVQPSGIKDL